MPKFADVTANKYAPQIRDFDVDNEGTNDFKGTFEYIKCVTDVRFFWYATPPELASFNNGAELVRNDGKSFRDNDGFSDGDFCELRFGYVGDPLYGFATFNIIKISEDGFTLFTDLNIPLLNNVPIDDDAGVLITGLTTLDNAKYSFGLKDKTESFTTRSKLTQETQNYLIKNILGVTDGEISGTIKGWASSFGDAPRIENKPKSALPIFRAPNFGENGGVPPADGVQNFTITHTIPVLPFFTVGDLENIKNGISQPFLEGSNTLSYCYSLEMSTSISDEDSQKNLKIESLQGSVGGFGENFNGIQTPYNFQSISYEVNSNPNDSLLAKGLTNVTCVLGNSEGSFSGSTKAIVVHSYLPKSETEYLQSKNYFEDNFVYESKAVGESGAILSNIVLNITNANSATLTFDVDTSTVPKELNADSDYLLYVILDDLSLDAEDSNRTALVLDVNKYDLNPDILDLLFVDSFTSFDHGLDITETGKNDYKGWVQDGYAVLGSFRLDRTKKAQLSKFEIDLVAWNDVTNDYFVINRNVFNLTSGGVDVNGNLQINIDEQLPFKLAVSDQFNQKELKSISFDGTFQTYEFLLGLKIDWQEWLSLPEADNIFLDVSLPNNGKNKNSSRYNLNNDYTLNTIIRATVLETDKNIETEYIHKMPMDINDFGVIGLEDWSLSIFTERDENNADVTPSVLFGETTNIKAVFTPNFAIVPNVDDYVGIIRIVKALPSGNNTIYELSTVRSAPSENLLIPLEGEPLTKISVDGSNNVVLECRTNVDLIEDTSYTVSARLSKKLAAPLGEFNDDFSDGFLV